MRVLSLGESQESSTLVELRGTRILIDAGLGLAASARLVQGEVDDCLDDCEADDENGINVVESKAKRRNRRHRRTTGRGEFLISPPAYRTALFEATDCGAIDAVLVTSAAGLLGLPYLVQAAAEAVGGGRAVASGDPRAGGVVSRRNADDRGAADGGGGTVDPLPAFLDPPFEVFATDLAVEMALAWISELGASAAAAGDAEATERRGGDDDDEGEKRRRTKDGGGRTRRFSSPRRRSHPLGGLPASVLASLTEGARRDLLGAVAGSGKGSGQGTSEDGALPPPPPSLVAWRPAYPAALARSLLEGGGGPGGGGVVGGRAVTRVRYGERVRLRGGAIVAVASPAGGTSGAPSSATAAPPGSAVWTLVDAVAEASSSLVACSGMVSPPASERDGTGRDEPDEDVGVARVVCVGACGGLGPGPGTGSGGESSSSAAAPLDVSELRGAHVLVLAPPEEPPPPPAPAPGQPPRKPPSPAAATPSSACFALAAAAAASALDRGGSALLPVPSAGDGRSLELVEAVLSALAPRMGGGGGGGSRGGGHEAPLVVFASPGAKRATAASCSSAEWLCAARSALVLSGRAPFFAGAAAAAAASVIGGSGGGESNASASSSAGAANRSSAAGGGLVVADSLSEAREKHGWREPCVAFVPESSLFNFGGGGGGGDGAALLRSWGGDPRSAVIFAYSLSPPPSGARLSELVSAAFPAMRARIVDVEAEVLGGARADAGAKERASPPRSSARALSLASLAAAVAPKVLVVPRRWERAMLEASSSARVPLGGACGRIEPLEPLVALELDEGGAGADARGAGPSPAALPAPLSCAGVTAELASAASKGRGSKTHFPSSPSPSSRVLALATLRDGEVELDVPPGASSGGAALVAAALVVAGAAARPCSSSLDDLLSELGAPAPSPPSVKAEEPARK